MGKSAQPKTVFFWPWPSLSKQKHVLSGLLNVYKEGKLENVAGLETEMEIGEEQPN